ncbi:unnamed protein product [Caenorhabditis angaria]|uniref:Uncharacterized protein n=1 Tax=Caenorhabditis angaria TaxID=860376 RepID=A0A9P1IAL3_9PELO|nr:unnamed protein product [Caenorhabditis angaria]
MNSVQFLTFLFFIFFNCSFAHDDSFERDILDAAFQLNEFPRTSSNRRVRIDQAENDEEDMQQAVQILGKATDLLGSIITSENSPLPFSFLSTLNSNRGRN